MKALENRPLAKIRQDVLREDPVDLRECAMATRLPGQRLGLEFAPQLKDGLKGVRGHSGGRSAVLATLPARIDALGDQIAGFIPPGASVPQADCRIDTERNARLLPTPAAPTLIIATCTSWVSATI